MIIAITGGTASGKTTVAKLLQEKIGEDKAVLLDLDSYYKDQSHVPDEERDSINFDHPAAFDRELFLDHLDKIRNGENITKPVYDFSSHARLDKGELFSPKDIIIVEGLFALVFDDLNEQYDLKVFVDASDDVRLDRRIKRDVKERGRSVESVVEQYVSTVRPMYRKYIAPTKNNADIVVKWEKDKEQALQEIIERIL